ncbi:MAG: glycosyltransferase family 9 protein [Thermodesulfovibrio sp.]|nr:glycosyltransferase family 9 protein [Thermodesulfovibrio sp.]
MRKLTILIKNWHFYLKRFFRKFDHKITFFILSCLVKIGIGRGRKEDLKQNILCFITENIGDTIRASGVIDFMNTNFKSHFVCTEYNKEILKLCGVKDEQMITLKRDPGFLDFIKIIRKNNLHKWDTSLILDYTETMLFAIYTSKLAGIGRIIYKIYKDSDLENLRTLAENANVDILTVAKYLIVKDFFYVPLKKEIKINTDDKFSQYKDYIGIHVGGFGSILYPVSRKYPEVYTFQLIESLLKEGYKVLITGDSFDRKSFRRYARELSKYEKFLDLSGKLLLYELASLLKVLKAYITPDNGTLHLAQAVGCKEIIAILGPTSPLLVRGKNTTIIRLDLACSPCLNFLKFPVRCINPNYHQCLKDLTPEMVINVIKSKINAYI